jgi:hypothetical protein
VADRREDLGSVELHSNAVTVKVPSKGLRRRSRHCITRVGRGEGQQFDLLNRLLVGSFGAVLEQRRR